MSGGDWKSMFKAVQEDDFELVKFYLNMGIDPNYQHPEFMASPLVESIRYNHLKIAKLLLESGGNPSIKEVMGQETPMLVAKKLNNQKAIDLLNFYINKPE
ncbi:ankyrin repeat domain-containing protein [Flavivirga eckloniae]|uniref:Ankyrin repeat domain-containing protein n=1 Tax=Flavivirga eckloniae TaxID=1803846 RepID=A0A2K9PP80_9FLAO|nr:ankyrin repeat domain-containing protein [Flavivirga eckloniae]AUP78387.1 ankyrin repeat domain-containing protein [Flavivirga eckloniae]